MSDDARQLWSNFCGQLQSLGDAFLGGGSPYAHDPDSLRLLGHHLATTLDWCLGADPDFPRFAYVNNKGTWLAHEDMCQLAAPVRGDAAYRIHGNVSGLFDLNICLHDGPLNRSGNWGNFGLDELETEADGSFTLVISQQRRPGNWIEMRAQAALVSVRQYCHDWTRHRPAPLEIERIDSENAAPPRATPAQTAERLGEAAGQLGELLEFLAATAAFQTQGPFNTLGPPTRAATGSSHICYGWGHYQLDADEALVITFVPPRARQWTVEWLTPLFIKGDTINHQTSLNGCSARVDADGRVRIVVSGQDPGVQNWLDIGGYPSGLLSYRWIRSEDAPQPYAQRAALRELHTLLPADTPPFGPDERALQRTIRRRQMAWRWR